MAKQDAYETITQAIIRELEQGTVPWVKPWDINSSSNPRPYNGVSCRPYTGVNVLILWGAAATHGYTSPDWYTFKQVNGLGGHVVKGERATSIVFMAPVTKVKTDGSVDKYSFLRMYHVFNRQQCLGLPEPVQAMPVLAKPRPAIERDPVIDAWVCATQVNLVHGGDRAFYRPSGDTVHMPPFNAFHGPENYYATLLHEMVHWTSHKNRLDREFGRKRWGDQGYAMEELVAEIGAAFLCADLGVTGELRHAGYIESWLKVLRDDKRAIFTAASHATAASTYLHTFSQAQDIRNMDDEQLAA